MKEISGEERLNSSVPCGAVIKKGGLKGHPNNNEGTNNSFTIKFAIVNIDTK
jgi:hypothetical protein